MTRKLSIDRFFEKVEAMEGGCMIWRGHVASNGYGVFHEGDGSARLVKAHRWSYGNFTGPIPDGLQLDHLCRTRSCVNPEHLEPVTNKENQRRGFDSNASKAHCVSGHPLSGPNLYVYPSTGKRECRACRRARDARRRPTTRNGYLKERRS